MKKKLILGLAAMLAGSLALSGCASNGGSGADGGDSANDTVEVGFFGFSAANSFAQAVYKGVEEASTEAGAKSTFVDGQFDGQLQVQQINDAITSKRYDVIIIQANDNLAVQEPLKKAVDAGITVVVEFAPVGPELDRSRERSASLILQSAMARRWPSSRVSRAKRSAKGARSHTWRAALRFPSTRRARTRC